MPVSAQELRVGERRELVLTEDLTRTQIVMYAGASGDFHPAHTDERFTREMGGHPGVFAHGMLTMGMTGRILTDWFGADRLTRYSARFVAPVWPGDRLVATAVVDALREDPSGSHADVTLTTTNQDGTTVLTGSASARLDP